MAIFILYGKSSSSSTRIYMSTLIALVLFCSFSCCASSSAALFGSSAGDIGEKLDDIGINKNVPGQPNNQNADPPRLSTFSVHYLKSIKNPKVSQSRLVDLLLNAAVNQIEDRLNYEYQHLSNRRYAPQSFHAMRG